jgi:hypothetical protein
MKMSKHQSIQQAAALQEQHAIAMLHDWRAYLSAQICLLDRQTCTIDLFEQSDRSARFQAAEADLAAVDPDRRSLFERAVDQRREQRRRETEAEQQAQGSAALPDFDALDRLVWVELLREASEPDATGHVLFPDGTDQQVEWMELRADSLTERPDEADYRAASLVRGRRGRAMRWLSGLGAATMLTLSIWQLVAATSPASDAARASAPMDDLSLTAWKATGLTVSGTITTTVELFPATDQPWPADGKAYMRVGTTLPQSICVPGALLDGAQRVTIVGDGVSPDRAYLLDGASGQPAPDLLLSDCGAAEHQRSGTLQQIVAVPIASVGDQQQVGAATIRLTEVHVIGAAELPDIPQGASRIAAVFATDGATIDWVALTPVLRMGTGTQQTAPEIVERPDGATELRFLVGMPAEALEGELRLTDPGNGMVARWAIVIDRPMDRLSVLRAVLRVDTPTVSGRELSIAITNTGARPLKLTGADLWLEARGSRLSISGATGLDLPLEPGKTRILTLPLPPDLGEIATLTVGPASFQIVSE